MYIPEESLLEQWVSRERLTRYRDVDAAMSLILSHQETVQHP